MTPEETASFISKKREELVSDDYLGEWFFGEKRRDFFNPSVINEDDDLETKLRIANNYREIYKDCLFKYIEHNRVPVEILEKIKNERIGNFGYILLVFKKEIKKAKPVIEEELIDKEEETEDPSEEIDHENEEIYIEYEALSHDNTIHNAFKAKKESGNFNRLSINDTDYDLSEYAIYATERKFFKRTNKNGIINLLSSSHCHLRVKNDYYYPQESKACEFEYLPDHKNFSKKVKECDALVAGSSCMHHLNKCKDWEYGDIDIFTYKTKLLNWIIRNFDIETLEVSPWISTFISIRIYLNHENKRYEINYILVVGEENEYKGFIEYVRPKGIKTKLMNNLGFNNESENHNQEKLKVYIANSFDISICCTYYDGERMHYSKYTENKEGVIYLNTFRRNTTLGRIRKYIQRGYTLIPFNEKNDLLDLICETKRG